jgi:hypothetical protein
VASGKRCIEQRESRVVPLSALQLAGSCSSCGLVQARCTVYPKGAAAPLSRCDAYMLTVP